MIDILTKRRYLDSETDTQEEPYVDMKEEIRVMQLLPRNTKDFQPIPEGKRAA